MDALENAFEQINIATTHVLAIDQYVEMTTKMTDNTEEYLLRIHVNKLHKCLSEITAFVESVERYRDRINSFYELIEKGINNILSIKSFCNMLSRVTNSNDDIKLIANSHMLLEGQVEKTTDLLKSMKDSFKIFEKLLNKEHGIDDSQYFKTLKGVKIPE